MRLSLKVGKAEQWGVGSGEWGVGQGLGGLACVCVVGGRGAVFTSSNRFFDVFLSSSKEEDVRSVTSERKDKLLTTIKRRKKSKENKKHLKDFGKKDNLLLTSLSCA